MTSWCWNPPHVELWGVSDNNVEVNWFVLFLSATLDVIQVRNWAKSPSGFFKFVKSLSIHPSLQPITHLLWHTRTCTHNVSSWGWETHLSVFVCVWVCVLQGVSNWPLTNAQWESMSAAAGLAEVRGHWRKSTRLPRRAVSASSISVRASARKTHTHTHTHTHAHIRING